MKRLFSILLLGLSLWIAGSAGAELPTLIDRELFFGDPEISAAQLSPDGKHISFIKPYKDVRNIYVKGIDEPFDAAKPVTADERPVPAYFWSEDGKFLLYVQDKGGNENFHVYAVNPDGTPEAATGVPAALDLTPVDGVRAVIYAVPENTPGQIIVGLNDRDATYHDVYKVDIATGKREVLIENTQKVGYWVFDLEGNVRLASRQTDDGGTEILRVEGKDLVQCYTCTYLEECGPDRFHKDGKRVYMQTNKGDKVDLVRLTLFDPVSGKEEVVDTDPEKEVDLGGAAFDDKTEELAATFYTGDRTRIYAKNDQVKKDLERIWKKLPEGNLGWPSSTEDGRYHLISISSDVDPGSVHLYDREDGSIDLLYRSRPDLPSDQLAVMKPIKIKARDGLMIPAYLTLPKGVPAKNLPTIIHPHGGPWARDDWGYDAYAQFLANRGYAVIQPNFRSSGGYGKTFLNAGNKQWGIGTMQHDLTDCVKYLVDQGIADPKRVGIYGGSYGGYATLAGVTFTPDLYACGIPYVAPSSIITLIESFPAYWRPFLKGSWYMRVGDPEVAADREDMEKRSPINFIDNIKVPLLVVHGANDPRVKQAESDRIVVALRDKGHDVEYIVAPDEGHGFRSPENRMALAVTMEKFLAKHLGGRYQKEAPEDLLAHLGGITVDVKTVTLPAASLGALLAEAKTSALPAMNGSLIQPASLTYKVKLEMGQQTMDMDMTRTIEEVKEGSETCWRITDAAKSPMGNMTDAFDCNRKTLLPIKRNADGMGTMKFSYTATSIQGEMGGMGQTMPVNVVLDAPVVGDGPALVLAVSGLPLAKGYETMLRYYDPMTQKLRYMKLTVEGTEKVTVPAGAFETLIVKIVPLDDEPSGTATLRVMQEAPHHTVKSEWKLPAQMGGGMFREELASIAARAQGDSD